MACILVTLDGSPESEQALPWALSQLRPEDELRLLRVQEPLNMATQWALQLQDQLRGECQLYLEQQAEALRAREVRTTTVLRFGSPAEEIVDEARDRHADLVFMSTHGRGSASRFLLGSVAARVARAAPCPVWLVRVGGEREWSALNTVLVPLDGSEVGLKGLDFVRTWMRGEPSRLLLLTATGQPSDEEAGELETYLRERAQDLRAQGWQVDWKVRPGGAAEAILEEAAAEHASLIAMGTCGAPAWLGGRVAERVLEYARCPVVLINSRVAATAAVPALEVTSWQS